MDRDGGNKERMRKCREWLFLHFHPEALSSMNMLQNLFRFIESLRTALSDSESRYVWFWQCSSTFKMQPSEINLAFSEPWMASLAVLIHWLVRLAYIFATRPSRHWRKVQWLFHQYCFALHCNAMQNRVYTYIFISWNGCTQAIKCRIRKMENCFCSQHFESYNQWPLHWLQEWKIMYLLSITKLS